jgi:hypothetical protein
MNAFLGFDTFVEVLMTGKDDVHPVFDEQRLEQRYRFFLATGLSLS